MEHNQLKFLCEDLLKEAVSEIKKQPGGDVNHTYQIETIHNTYFCKTNISGVGEDLLQQEEANLKVLSRYCTTPKVVQSGPQILLMSWVQAGKKSKHFWQKLGRGLATLHRITSNQFGLDSDNYIGHLPQNNSAKASWDEFYVTRRLEPQLHMAVDNGLLHQIELPSLERMQKVIEEVCPSETASLIHGDLWSGNILCDTDGEAYFIDPSISYAHREMDIAMSSLFGKFDKEFYEAYEEVYPLANGLKKRLDIYQLYYLLAHLNMFGIGYKNDVLKIIKHYFG